MTDERSTEHTRLIDASPARVFDAFRDPAKLARWSQIDAGAMTRLLDRLEKKGLCTRVRSTEDRRVVMVELTAEGKAAMDHVPEVLADVMNQHLTGFSKTEWQALLGYLRLMVETGEALKDSG